MERPRQVRLVAFGRVLGHHVDSRRHREVSVDGQPGLGLMQPIVAAPSLR